jgi:hypothetical protein
MPTEDVIEVSAPPKQTKADGFNWGSECQGGSGSFAQLVERNRVVTVGTIPQGKANIEITLAAGGDVDIQLDGANGTKIVNWQGGLLDGSEAATRQYNGMTISYSGYNGVDGDPGKETLKIEGVTTEPLVMKAYGYAQGQATVTYKWQARPNCVDSGNGTFTQALTQGQVVEIGRIPPGLKNIRVQLQSSVDVDIQLEDANGAKVVHWESGLLRCASNCSASYRGVSVKWSGYNGDGTGPGNEQIEISGTTQNEFVMRAFGYQGGTATVKYSWGNSGPAPGPDPDPNTLPFSTRLQNFATKYPGYVTLATKQGQPAIFLKTTAFAQDEDQVRAFYKDLYAMVGPSTLMVWNPAQENYFHLVTPNTTLFSARFRNRALRLYSHIHVWNIELGNLDDECYAEDDDDDEGYADLVETACLQPDQVSKERTVALLKMTDAELAGLNTYLNAIADDFEATLGPANYNGGTPPYLGGGTNGEHNCTSWFSIWANQKVSSSLPQYANPASLLQAYTKGNSGGTLSSAFRALLVFNHPNPPQPGADLDRSFPLEFGH